MTQGNRSAPLRTPEKQTSCETVVASFTRYLLMTLVWVVVLSSICHGAPRGSSRRIVLPNGSRQGRIEARHTAVTLDDRKEVRQVSTLLAAREYRLGSLRIDDARHLHGERVRYRKELSESAKQSMTRETDMLTGRAMGTQGADSGSSFWIKKRKKLRGNLF